MASPLVSWYSADNITQISSWEIGTVDAGSTSPDITFLIWNNRAGVTLVSDMTSCTITTKDSAGGDTGELVVDKWIQVRVDTMSEGTFTAIGGTVAKSIKAGGTAGAGTIEGAINDGTMVGAPNNFAQVTLHAVPLATATAGNVDFLLRVAYTYV